ncbi:hypothetical protein EDB87DRAFT_1682049 [Lactarius vividus]|nr:hypothetical protein EDB87DRAFT_1682049 [Lactarius vividus]
MLAVLCSSPRPPLGVALLGFTIVILRWMLHLLPYIMFCGMITLSVWPPSHPLPPDVTYYPVNGRSNQARMAYTRVDSQPSKKEARSFELSAELRIFVFLLAVPVTSIVENAFFRPARSIFLRTIDCWFDMRYVHPAQISGSWPDTWTPIFNVLRSCDFVADFIDGATGRNSDPNLPTRDSHSFAQPAEQRVSSRQSKRASSPDPIVHSKLEGATDTHRPRKTFVSPPHIAPQSPWKANGLGGFSPVSKNLSRIVGIHFHHPSPRKPVIRHQINLMAKLPSARVQYHVFERLWSRHDNVALAWASTSSLGTLIRNSRTHWHDGAQLLHSTWDHVSNYVVTVVPELGEHITEGSLPHSMGSRFLPGTCEALTIEHTQFEQQQHYGYVRSPLTSLPLPEPPVQTFPPNFVSDWQGKQYNQLRSMQTPVYHRFPYQDQHIITPPVYRQQELHRRSFSELDSITLVQHGSHVYSDIPERPMADPEPIFKQRASLAPVIESPLPPFSSLPIDSQEKFTFRLLDDLPLFEFSEDAPLLDHSPPSTSPARPETSKMARTSDGYATTTVFVPCTTSQDEFSHPSSRPMSFDTPPKAVWSSYHHQSPTITSPVLQPRHIAQPFSGLRVAGTFTFDVSQVIPYFDFSHHLPLPSVGIELDVVPQGTTTMSFPSNPQEMNGAWPPPQQLSFDQGVQIQQVPCDTAFRPEEVVSNPLPHQPFPPTEQANSATVNTATRSSSGAKMSVDGNVGDDSSSDSDSSDSSDSDSDTDMDSDSDSSSSGDNSDSDSDDSSEDESDAVATETICKTSSRPPDATSKAQDDVQGVSTDKNKVADSDSDDDEYTPALAPGASNNDDSSSSDEDMSEHEEEDRLYWEKFYTPRHRRQPDVLGSV